MTTQPSIRVLVADPPPANEADAPAEAVEAVLKLATQPGKEVARDERGAREAFAGLSRNLLQFRDRLAH